MRLMHSKLGRIAAPVALAVALGGSAYAFMASNSVQESSAGVGSGTISGYNVSNITYTLSSANGNPDQITNVQFTLTPADSNGLPAQSVAVWFDNNTANVASSANQDCTIQSGSNSNSVTVNCNVTALNQMAGANSSTALDVAAAH
ncbi:MAG: hypothetical protein K6U14_05165 [Firmicutes bacterium]|nr:hypothetical protein [Alicyclobacillaceae bacterium]MCL6497008.1 hypothetical protein [Bacillota bacterium]